MGMGQKVPRGREMKTVYLKVRVDIDDFNEAQEMVKEWVEYGWKDHRIHEVIISQNAPAQERERRVTTIGGLDGRL